MKLRRSAPPTPSNRRILNALNDGLNEVGSFEHPGKAPVSMTYGSWLRILTGDIFSQIISNHLPERYPPFPFDTDYVALLSETVGSLATAAYATTDQYRRNKNPDEMAVAQPVGQAVVEYFAETHPTLIDTRFYVFKSILSEKFPRDSQLETTLGGVAIPSVRLTEAERTVTEDFDEIFAAHIDEDDANFPTVVLRHSVEQIAIDIAEPQLRAFESAVEEALLAAAATSR